MQINAIGAAALPGNQSFAATGQIAEQESFSAALSESVKKASASDVARRAASGAALDAEDAKLKAACRDFEALFLNMMYREMRASVPKDEFIGSNNAIELFEDMRDTELTKGVAQSGGIGIADLMYRQLTITRKRDAGEARSLQ